MTEWLIIIFLIFNFNLIIKINIINAILGLQMSLQLVLKRRNGWDGAKWDWTLDQSEPSSWNPNFIFL